MAKRGPKVTLFGTPETLEEIRILAGRGLTVTQIRCYYDKKADLWADLLEREPDLLQAVQHGRAKTVSFVAGKLMELVKKGNLGAIIFYLKTQARWRETDRPGDTNEEKREMPAIQFNVNDPVAAAKIYQQIMMGD